MSVKAVADKNNTFLVLSGLPGTDECIAGKWSVLLVNASRGWFSWFVA